jgi:Carboxypeptidase regulatory-like domain
MGGMRRLGILAMVGALLTGASPALAQITTGSIAGTVNDAQGGVIPGATVVLISESRGTRSAPATTDGTGNFVFPNVAVDTYTVEITMPSFRTLRRTGVPVNPGSRVTLGTLTIEVGGSTETVEVKGETPVIQAASGERSFTIPTESVQNLPISNRGFTSLAALSPGVVGTQALGTTANMSTNITMDGVSTLDTGSNGVMVNMNVESIAEVKVLVSGYQAEYGRSSGLQIMAVTKSGTNQFRGSLYDVERNSDWNANSKTNILNGIPKTISKEREWGYSIGGPIGKPGGNNKLFFFNAVEFRPRTGGNNLIQFRVPTELERQGDFSQTLDNNGNLYPYIKDPLLSGVCSAASQAACFAAGGVLGRIPQDRLYQPGLNILRMWPLPTSSNVVGTNLQFIRPPQDTLQYQPAIRFDYQALQSLRVSYKYQGQIDRKQVNQGTIPGWNDLITPYTGRGTDAVSVNYNLSSTMFLEGTYGRAWNQLAGGGGIPVNPVADARNTGLANLPLLFPNASVLNPDYYAYDVLNFQQPPYWDGTRIWKVPSFSWGNRVVASTNNQGAPPNVHYPGFLNVNRTQDVSISLTKVAGRHTLKAGYYQTHSLKRENNVSGGDNFGAISFANDTVGVNPFDTSFGFANAAIGSFSSFTQASAYVEGHFNYDNREFYAQDNWKINNRLTLDYGIRFVNATAQYDKLLQSGNFLPDRWSISDAPVLYVAGCANGVSPCTGTNRQAMNPLTGQFLGPNSTLAIGTVVPNSGNFTNGLFQSGRGISETTYTFPTLVVGPRFGMAYDLTGTQRAVVRGGAGIYFDRARPGNAQALVGNVFASELVTVRYSQMQSLGAGGLTTRGAPQLLAYEYDAKLPASASWNTGFQMMLPWATSLDVAYTGRHNYNAEQTANINTIDLGSGFDPSLQDRTVAASPIPGASSHAALNPNLVRGYQGYGTVNMRTYDGWRTFHSIELSINRRFQNGLQFGFNDTIVLSDVASVLPRYDHGPDGQTILRADQAQAQELLGSQTPQTHNFKASFVWDMPDLRSENRSLKALGLVVNDWQLSGIWTGSTASAYTIDKQYQTGNANVNLTGSPDFAPRILIVGDPGEGCSSDPYRQFNTSAFQGPPVGSVGLESGNDYLRGCFNSVWDLSIARNIRLGGNRTLQLRVDMFNAFNEARVTDRNNTMNLSSPADPVTILNLPYDANGNLLPNRVRPNQAGFGAVEDYQAPRSIQAYIRFGF